MGCMGGCGKKSTGSKPKSTTTRTTSGGSRPTGAAAWGKSTYGTAKVKVSFGKKR